MSYYFSKTVELPFDEAVERVKTELKKDDPDLGAIGLEVREKLKAVVERL
jgi:uncharacterized protein (DUF302 family)